MQTSARNLRKVDVEMLRKYVRKSIKEQLAVIFQ